MSPLQTSMLEYAGRFRFFDDNSKILVAVSGGIDSMVMLHLLHNTVFDSAKQPSVNMIVAHCNFGLRGEESDLDEAFVKNETTKLGIQCRVKQFDATTYAAQKGISIQMAARDLRYSWFHELADSEGCNIIAIAHNRDDSIETLFINLARGTGIHGLTGIRPKTGKIIRPLLFVSRNDIENYAKEHNVFFREDSTNATDKYARNYIRNQTIPGLEHFFPGIRQSIERSIEFFSDVELFYNEAIERYKNQIVSCADDLIYINLPALFQSPSPYTLLYEILKSYGFSKTIAAEILEEHKHPSGRQFFSDKYRLVHNRQTLIIQKQLSIDQSQEYLIEENTSYVDIPIRLKIEKFDNYHGFTPNTTPNVACLDGEKLQFPLILRKWQYGDTFRPLGMKNKKKLSDFFINAKLSLIEKEQCWVLVSGEKIVWIVGLRIDDRYKITNKTKIVISFDVGAGLAPALA